MLLFSTKALMFLEMFVGLILVGIILLQRGRGGGLAGAFGGMGGQSAFGTKAGDVFTKITIYIATVWIVLGCICVVMASNFKASNPTKFKEGAAAGLKEAPAKDAADDEEKKADGDEKPADGMKPGPGTPPATKSDTETKTEGDGPKDSTKTESKPDDAKPDNAEPAAKPATKEADPAEPKDGAAKPAEPADKPATATEKPVEPTDKKPE